MRKPSPLGHLLFGWLLALLTLVAVPMAQAQVRAAEPVVLIEGQTNISITQGVDYLIEEPGQPLTAEQALGASNWQRFEGRKLNLHRQRTPAWIRVSVENQAHHPWLLGVDWPPLEQLRFHQYESRTGRLMATHEAGLTAAKTRHLRDPGYVFALALRPGEQATVLLRVYTTAAMIVPLVAWEEKTYIASRYHHGLLMGLLFGILGIMLLYNASLFIFTRDRDYAYFAIYLFASTLFEIASTGYGALLFWGHDSWLTVRSFELFVCLTYLTGALFIVKALALKTTPWPHLLWMKYAAIAFWSIAALLVAFRPSLGLSLSIGWVAILGGLSAVYASAFLAVKGNITARYFAVAWASLMVCSTFHVLSLYGKIESNGFTAYGQHAGFVIELVLLSLALADRIKRNRLARAHALQETQTLTLSMQRERDENIQAQEEVIALQRHANDELEARVRDRTAELELAMSNLELTNTELAKLTVTDALTQVHNRRHFDEVLAREHERSALTGEPLTLLLADIDHFKRLNDSCGHLAGDDCLRQVAATLTHVIGHTPHLVARYGGEEFALVLPGTDAKEALAWAERARAAVEAMRFSYRGKVVPITISVGAVAQVTLPHGRVAEFIAEADAALYRAKALGRNRVVLA
jgi:two-component system, sensor histidine kinase LadS